METIHNLLFKLIFSGLKKEKIAETVKLKLDERFLKEIYDISFKYDVTQFVASCLYDNNILIDDYNVSDRFKEYQINAFKRYTLFEYEQKQVYSIFETLGIDYIPLKGSVIRKYYPEPYLRTSCDIDILVRESDLDRACLALCKTLGYEKEKKKFHDISLFSNNGVHLELHFNILENINSLDKLLSSVWQHANRVGDSHLYDMEPEFFVFYIIAHASYHFKSGGCGIKPLLDLFVLKSKFSYNESIVEKYCETCGILKFYKKILKLIDVWDDKCEHEEVTLEMEKYIISGGAYGSYNNRIAVSQTKLQSKYKYIFDRIFMKSTSLEILYPKLKKHPVLLPYYQLKRWRGIFTKNKLHRIINEIKINSRISDSDVSFVSDLFEELELN